MSTIIMHLTVVMKSIRYYLRAWRQLCRRQLLIAYAVIKAHTCQVIFRHTFVISGMATITNWRQGSVKCLKLC